MYTITYEWSTGFPTHFEPRDATYTVAASLAEARRHIRAVCGRTRRTMLSRDTDPALVERRRNARYIARITLGAAREALERASMQDAAGYLAGD